MTVRTSNVSWVTVKPPVPLDNTGWELVALSPDDWATVVARVSTFDNMTFSDSSAEQGAGSLTLDATDPILTKALPAGIPGTILDREYLWKVYEDGLFRGEWLYQDIEKDVVPDDETTAQVRLAGQGTLAVLTWGCMVPMLAWDDDSDVLAFTSKDFLSVRAATALFWLIGHVQIRGVLPFVTLLFDEEVDSKGQPWQDLQDVSVSPGETPLGLLQRFSDALGWEFRMLEGFRLFIAQNTVGSHRENEVKFFVGGDQKTHSYKATSREIANHIYTPAADGSMATAIGTSDATPHIREAWSEAGSEPSASAAAAVAQATLEMYQNRQVGRTVKVISREGRVPFDDFVVNDWVAIEDEYYNTEIVQVSSLTVEVNANSEVTYELTVMTKFETTAVRLKRLLDKMGAGGLGSTSSTPVSAGSEAQATVKFSLLKDVHVSAAVAGDVLTYSSAGGVFPVTLNLNYLSDVDTGTTPPVSGQVLKWNGTQWVPGVGAAGPSTLSTQTDVAVVGITTGQVLAWNPTTGKWSPVSLPSAGVSALSGLSDVLLTGNGTGKVLTYNGTKWVPATPATVVTSLGGLTTDVDTTGAVSGKVLAYNGTKWVPVTPSGGSGGSSLPAMNAGDLLTAGDVAGTTPVAVVAAYASSTYSSGYGPMQAFDTDPATYWHSQSESTSWITGQLAAAAVVVSCTIKHWASSTVDRSPRNFLIQGSNDNSAWTTVGTFAGVTWTVGETKTFTLTTSTAYLYYRVYITASNGDNYQNIATVSFAASVFGLTTLPVSPEAGKVLTTDPAAPARMKWATPSAAAAASTLDALTDVDTAGAISGKVLGFDGTNWVPVAQASGGSSGTTVEGLIYKTSWPVDGAPASPHVYNYEFGAETTILPAGWSWVNQGACTYVEKFGLGYLTDKSAAGGHNSRMIVRNAPAGYYMVTAKVRRAASTTGNYTQVGLSFYNSGTTALWSFDWDARGVGTWSWPTPSTYSSESGKVIPITGTDLYLQAEYTASGWQLRMSSDGVDFITVLSNQSLEAPDKVGFHINGEGQSIVGGIEWIRFGPNWSGVADNKVPVGIKALSDVNVNGATTGQVLTYDGSQWVAAAGNGSFTTEYSLHSVGAPTAGDTNSVVCATEFIAMESCNLTKVRFYQGSGTRSMATRTATVYEMTSEASYVQLFAPVSITATDTEGWMTTTLATPVPLTAGKTYRVCVLHPAGRFAYQAGYHTSTVDCGPLRRVSATQAIGGHQSAYVYSATMAMPVDASSNSAYFSDVGVQRTESSGADLLRLSGASFTGWTAAGGTWSSNGSEIIQIDLGAVDKAYYAQTVKFMPAFPAFEAEVQLVSGTGSDQSLGMIIGMGTGGSGGAIARVQYTGSEWNMLIEREGAVNISTVPLGSSPALGTWHKLRLELGGHLAVYWDGVLVATGDAGASISADNIGLYTRYASAKFRNIRVLKANTPTYTPPTGTMVFEDGYTVSKLYYPGWIAKKGSVYYLCVQPTTEDPELGTVYHTTSTPVDGAAWTRNNISTNDTTNHVVNLIEGQGSRTASVISNETFTFPATGLSLRMRASTNGQADGLVMGILNGTVSSTQTLALAGIPGFFGVVIDLWNNVYKCFFNGAVHAETFALASRNNDDTYEVRYEANSISLYTSQGELIKKWSSTSPYGAMTTFKPAFGAFTGGSSATFKVYGTPILSGPTLAWRPFSTAAAVAAPTTVINAQTGTTYTLALADAGKTVELSNAAAITLTVPPNSGVDFPTGTRIDLIQTGAGQVTVAPGSGVTLVARTGLKIAGQWAGASLIKRATDSWVLIGALST